MGVRDRADPIGSSRAIFTLAYYERPRSQPLDIVLRTRVVGTVGVLY